jgi:hypothetical protein
VSNPLELHYSFTVRLPSPQEFDPYQFIRVLYVHKSPEDYAEQELGIPREIFQLCSAIGSAYSDTNRFYFLQQHKDLERFLAEQYRKHSPEAPHD